MDHLPEPDRTPAVAGLARVLTDTANARGLPPALYTRSGFLEVERERLFAPTWAGLGFACDVPAPGDVRPVSMLGLPLILLRDRAGAVRVFHNVCSHRGRQLVDNPCRAVTGLRCPYHSWHYGLDGALRGTPHIGGPGVHACEGFDHARHGLREVRSHVWCDIVFVNLSGDAVAFGQHITSVTDRWRPLWGENGPATLRPAGDDGRAVLDVAANWKLAVENYCESYHLPWVHPGLNSYSRLEDHYRITDGQDGTFAGQGTLAYNLAHVAGVSLPPLPAWPPARQREAEYLALYPNVLLGLQADQFFVVLLEPRSEESTREHLRLQYVGEAASDGHHARARRETLEAWRRVFEEDVAAVEGMQRGRRSPACEGGVFSPFHDVPTHHFHQWVARRLMPARTLPRAVEA